jgi:hypothetical protein
LTFVVFLSLAAQAVWAQDEGIVVLITNDMEENSLKQKMEENASRLLTAFNEAVKTGKKPNIPGGVITEETKKKLKDLWSMSAMACKVPVIQEQYLKTYEKEYQIRNIPMTMYAATSDSTKYEEIALTFAPNGMINNIEITLKKHQYMHVDWTAVADTEQEQRIKEFIDRFRDAYNCKDIKTLDIFFSNDALIVTGKRITRKPNSDGTLKEALPGERFVKQVQTKTQYLAKMKNIFKNNEYLNIVFDSVEIVKHPKLDPKYKDIYGVTLKQYWNSSTYSDIGYLFLLINCCRKDQMEIVVRTWQAENEIDSYDDIFGFSTFKIEVL